MWRRSAATAFVLGITAIAAQSGAARAQDGRPAMLTGRGRYTVVARRVGFARYESQIVFDTGATVERRILLPRLQTLNSVRVVGDSYLPLSFIDHRARGFGHFMTREELAKTGLAKLSDVVSQIPGIGISNGTRGQGWVSSNRHMMTIRSITQTENHPGDDTYVPDATERRSGMVKGCYARVYLDNQLLNPYTPAEPINVNEFSPDRLEAIEFYSGPAQTPPEYSRLNSTCGVLVLHTRWSP